MRSGTILVVLAAVASLLAPATAGAQEPVTSFDQLGTRLKPGDTVWVTDSQGREIKGTIHTLAPGALTLDGRRSAPLPADAVSQIVKPTGRRVGAGALWGLMGGVAVGAILGSAADDGIVCNDGSCTLAGGLLFAGLGAGVGAIVGSFLDGKPVVVYRAPAAGGRSAARLSIAPLVTRRAKGAAVSFSF